MADLRNIALTLNAGEAASTLKEVLGMAEQMDVIRTGFAYAVRLRLDLRRENDFGPVAGSNYTTGGLDSDGLMARSVELFYESSAINDEPYRAVETLMNKGLLRLAKDMRSGTLGSLSDLVALPQPEVR